MFKTSLYILMIVMTVALTTACNSFTSKNPGTLSTPTVLTQAAFQNTVYAYVNSQSCSNCHASGPAPEQYWFASPNLTTAFQAAAALVNPSSAGASVFAVQVSDDHCGFANICGVSNSAMLTALNNWVSQSLSSESCTFGTQTLVGGATNISGFTAASVPFGSTCTAITNISCSLGVISPAGASPTCSAATVAGSTFVPTMQSALLRINIGLNPAGSTTFQCQTGVNAANCKSVWQNSGQFNLPLDSNPQNSSGEDQFSLLAYAGCNDINPSTFGVTVSDTVANQTSNLIAAGIQMVNNHMGGLASSPTYSSQISTLITSLINDPTYAGATTKQVFIGICTGANTFGLGMKGF